MKIAFWIIGILLSTLSFAKELPSNLSAQEALQRLTEGNSRFVEGKMRYPHQDAQRRHEVAKAQKPFAIILGCADSRVPPEIVFDQGIGDLFDTRVAGNVVEPFTLGSIVYSVEVLGVRLIIVLGHQRCGAVMAALSSHPAEGEVGVIIDSIRQAIQGAPKRMKDPLDNAIANNVIYAVETALPGSTALRSRLNEGTLSIVGAIYSLDTGKVQFLPSSTQPQADANRP